MKRPVEINPVTNGYIVHCGCMELVFTDRDKMLTEIDKYYDDPDKVEREYIEKYGPCRPLPALKPPLKKNWNEGADMAAGNAQAERLR